ncbi:MAG: thiopeptide-type bacteriocin biosynthesis protein [Acidobacteriota bacterium]
MRDVWLSAYLGFADSSAGIYGTVCDRLLLEVVEPRLARWQSGDGGGLVDASFFVRYESAEHGHHLRLRLRPTSDEAAQTLRAELSTLADEDAVDALAWVPFEPELERYGGATGARLAEDVFDASSRSALSLLHKIAPDDRAARLGKALLAQLVFLHVFDPHRERAAALALRCAEASTRRRAGDAERVARWTDEHRAGFDRQSNQLVPYVEAAWSALEAGAPTTAELDSLRARLVVARDALRQASDRGDLDGLETWPVAVRALLPSYLHMMNNRLGVDLREECYLAVVVASTLSEIPELAGSAGAADRTRAPTQHRAARSRTAPSDRRTP